MIVLVERLKFAVERVVTDPILCGCADPAMLHDVHFASNYSIFKLALDGAVSSARSPVMAGVFRVRHSDDMNNYSHFRSHLNSSRYLGTRMHAMVIR